MLKQFFTAMSPGNRPVVPLYDFSNSEKNRQSVKIADDSKVHYRSPKALFDPRQPSSKASRNYPVPLGMEVFVVPAQQFVFVQAGPAAHRFTETFKVVTSAHEQIQALHPILTHVVETARKLAGEFSSPAHRFSPEGRLVTDLLQSLDDFVPAYLCATSEAAKAVVVNAVAHSHGPVFEPTVVASAVAAMAVGSKSVFPTEKFATEQKPNKGQGWQGGSWQKNKGTGNGGAGKGDAPKSS